MIERICLGLTLPLLLGAVQEELPANWKVVSSPDGRFTVAMPGTPTDKTQQVKTATGSLDVTMKIAEGRNDSLLVVSYSDYPEADLKKSAIEKRLDYARDGAVGGKAGKLRSETAVKLDGHPGRELVIEKEGEVVARMRIFLVKNRLYQVMTLGNVPAKETTAFLDSFRLNK